MNEMQRLKSLLNPQEILFIADAMTGQDAVRSAEEFHKRLALTGVVLTKMDGDARGGAALSIRHVTGQPVKFIGVGEKPDAFEPFHPDRIVGRILGMGDIMTLIEKAEENLDRKKSEEFAKKAFSGGGFSLEDFRDQLRQIRKLGSMQSILKMLPSVGPFQGIQQMAEHVDESQFARVEAIINSMTKKERDQPRDHLRQPPQAYRSRLRNIGAGRESDAAPVCPDAQDVQERRERRRHAAQADEHLGRDARHGPYRCGSLRLKLQDQLDEITASDAEPGAAGAARRERTRRRRSFCLRDRDENPAGGRKGSRRSPCPTRRIEWSAAPICSRWGR